MGRPDPIDPDPIDPDLIRLDDLGAPRFTPEVEAILGAMADLAPACVLEVDALLDAAVRQEGLDDFGDDRFLEPLGVLTRALREEGGLSPPGTVSLHTQLVQLLVNRLRITDLLKRHPEITDLPIEAPIVIAGLPRTGTTHLHNLLAADPRLRSLPYWESIEPVLAANDRPAAGAQDPRLARTQAALDVLHAALPHFNAMHEMTVDHVHEEIGLLAITGSSMYFETMALLPSWREWYLATDQTPYYAELRTILQVLTFLRGGDRWVLKSPQHLEQFDAVRTVFPDATVIVTHRDPVAVTTSLATMIAYTARLHVVPPDPGAIGAYWADRVETMLRACVCDRDLLPAERSLDVRLDDFLADDLGTVEHIYDRAGQPLTPDSRAAMLAYRDTHRPGRHGRIDYDPALLGIDRRDRLEALRFYTERFEVRIEEARP